MPLHPSNPTPLVHERWTHPTDPAVEITAAAEPAGGPDGAGVRVWIANLRAGSQRAHHYASGDEAMDTVTRFRDQLCARGYRRDA